MHSVKKKKRIRGNSSPRIIMYYTLSTFCIPISTSSQFVVVSYRRYHYTYTYHIIQMQVYHSDSTQLVARSSRPR